VVIRTGMQLSRAAWCGMQHGNQAIPLWCRAGADNQGYRAKPRQNCYFWVKDGLGGNVWSGLQLRKEDAEGHTGLANH